MRHAIFLALSVTALLIIGFSFSHTQNAQAYFHIESYGNNHFDPPSPPAYKVEITLDKVKMVDKTDVADGIDLNGEFEVFIAVNHEGHREARHKMSVDELYGDSWNMNKRILTDDDCDPVNPISVAVVVTSIDEDVSTDILIFVASAAASALTAELGPAGSLAAGALVETAGNIIQDKNNEYRSGVDIFTGSTSGQFDINVTDEKGKIYAIATISKKVTRQPYSDSFCLEERWTETPTNGETHKDKKQGMVFPDARDALSKLSSFPQIEPGTNELTDMEIDGFKETISSLLVNMAESTASIQIEKNPNGVLTSNAISAFEEGQKLKREGNYDGAILAYENAYDLVTLTDEEHSEYNQIPFQIILTPEVLTIKKGYSPTILATVVGTSDKVDLTAVPSSVNVEITKIDHENNLFSIKLDLDEVAIGTHNLEMIASNGQNEARRNLDVTILADLGTTNQCAPGTYLENKICVPDKEKGAGCLIATATYGSELASQVQQLRELRDNSLLQTKSGTSFMTGFNQFYYSFSPTIADWERQNPMFKELVKATITPMLSTMSILNYADIDSEQEMIGYGIGVILLNIGIYFVTPAIIVVKLRQKFRTI